MIIAEAKASVPVTPVSTNLAQVCVCVRVCSKIYIIDILID